MKADLIIKNAKIYTVAITVKEIQKGKTDFPVYENGYVAVYDGKIVEVGQGFNGDIVSSKTKVIDAKGKILLPGLIDSHMHAMFAALDLMYVACEEVKNIGELIEILKKRAEETPAGQWIQGKGYNELLWDKPIVPAKEYLDQVSTEHPIYVGRSCFHVAAVNSKALELAGITKDTPNPVGGIIGRDKNGEPNGILYENSAFELVKGIIPSLSQQQLVEQIESIGKVLNENGITSVIDCNMSFNQMRSYNLALHQGKLTYRDNMMFYLDKAMGDVSYHLRRIDEMVATTGFGNDMLKINGIKITLDGIPATGTAYMREPYEHMPETCGYMTLTEDEMIEIAKCAAKYNWQIGVHTIGDKAADVALAAFKAAYEVSGDVDARHYLIHHPFPCDDQIELMKKMNVGVTMQPTIFSKLGEEAILDKRKRNLNVPCKKYFDAEIIVGGSTDCPVVPCSPFYGMYAAVTRKTVASGVIGPEEKITPTQALFMWTKNSAYFSHDDDKMGSIEVGNFGDMILIDTDILNCDRDEIKDTKVKLTILGGKIVFEV